jgi:hypothetical protein
MVTETDEVEGALDRVRAADPDGKVNLAELVVLGADAKVKELARHRDDDARRAALRESFLDRTRTGAGIDWDALTHVHEHGWVHESDG